MTPSQLEKDNARTIKVVGWFLVAMYSVVNGILIYSIWR